MHLNTQVKYLGYLRKVTIFTRIESWLTQVVDV